MHAKIAQLVEPLLCNQEVAGSNPALSSNPMLGKKLKQKAIESVKEIALSHISEEEVFDLKHFLARIIAPRIRHFRQITDNSHPADLTKQEWQDILFKMETSFEWFADPRNFKNKEESELHMEGIELFSKYYNFLWHSHD